MKTNFLSLKGMRLKGRSMNDPEITRKSRGNHPVITRFSRLITSTLLLLFTLAIGNVLANQTDLVTDVTLPDVPASCLDMASQSAYTPDANGWIVFNPYSVTSTWWKVTSQSSQSATCDQARLDALTPIAPFVPLTSGNAQKINYNGNYAAAVRFKGATNISFLVHPRSSKTFYVGLYSYNPSTSAQVLIEEKSVSGNNANVIEYTGLTTSIEYIAYMYGKVSQNMSILELAIKAPVNTDGPFAVTYDKNNEGASGTMTDANSPYAKDATVTVLGNSFTAPTGMVFAGWNTKADGLGTSYAAGNTFNAVKDVTLYAQWAYPATGTGTITYTLTKGKADVSAEVSGVSTLSSSSTAFSVSTLAIGSNNAKDGYSGQITGHAADYSASQYVALQFTVADGYTFTPSAVSMQVFANSTSNMKMKLVFTDGVTSVESEELACSSSADSDIGFASGAFTGKKFVGNVNVILYQWGVTSKRTYVKSPVTITGTVAAAVPVTNYTVTIDPNGGSYASTPDGWTYDSENDKYTKSVASGTSFSAPAGLTKGTDDLSWKDGSDNDVTFPVSISGDITFVAQWAPHAASDDATLSALSVAGCTLNETFDPDEEDYTVTLPFYASMPAVADVTATKNDANAEDPEVSISSNVITIHCEAEDGTTKDYTVTVTISPAPTASTSVNIEQNILDNGKAWGYAAALTAANIVVDGTNGLDSLNDAAGKTARNYGFLGLKFNKAKDIIKVIVPASSVLNVKFGNIATAINVTINGVTQTPIATKTDGTSTVYHLDAAAGVREVIFNLGVASKTVTLQQVKIGADVDPVTLPWEVTYSVDGAKGTCAKSSDVWKGSALTLPGVTPESGWTFDGWNDGTTDYAAGDPYTPTANVTMTAQFTAQASPFDLTSLTYKIGTGAATNVGYADGTFTYNIVLPYASSYDAITVTPVLKEATSSLKGDEVLTVSSLPGAATFTVVASDLSEQLYTVNFSKAPKDGVCLVKIEPTSQTKGTQTGLYHDGDELTINLSSGMNLGGSGKYIGVKATENFQEGDILHLDLNAHPNTTGSVQIILYADNAASTELWATGEEASVADDYNLTLPAAVNNHKELYIVRTDGNKWNGGPTVMEVLRPMNPVLTAIQFNSTDVAVSSTSVSATLPNGTNLGTMTVTPTIVWNGAGTAVVTSNAGAWAWGPNTYVVTDKDGDATTYTINLTEDVVKHTVSFNTHGGSAVASEEVEHNGYLAAAPADPTKDDYLFQYWSESEDGAEVDVTTVQITADKEFHAVWVADGAIKLLDGATVNHTNFITGVTADETVEFKGNTVNYAKFSGTCSGVNSVKDLTRVIAYNATTNKTKIRISAHNNSTSARNILVKGLVEGADAAVDLATIALGNKEDKVSDWIEFDNAANRTIYIMVSSSAGDVYFTQVKVIESGETPMKQVGEAGYSLNLNKGRFFGTASTDLAFEGLNARLSGDYTALNSGYAKIKETSMSFTVAAPLTLTVTTNNNKTYYVTKGAAGTDNETAKTGASEFSLTAGTWYITGGTAEVQITNIAFSAPKCAEPAFNALANSDICEGDPYVALNGTATVADAGVPTYQWYKEDNTPIDGATSAEYTPTEDGKYYVIAINHLAGFTDNEKKSDLVTVATVAGTVINAAPANVRDDAGEEATLIVDASGKDLHYVWKECATIDGTYTDVAGAADAASLVVTVPTGVKYYKVVVSSACGADAEAIAKVEEWVDFSQVNVSENTNWDFTTCADAEIKLTDATTPKKGEEYLMANIRGVHYDDPAFNAQALIFAGEYIYRNVTGKPLGAIKLKFTTTVDGFVTVRFADNGNNNRCLRVTDSEGVEFSQSSASNSDIQEFTTFVHAGDIEIMGVKEDHTGENQYVRIFNLAFEKADYSRAVNAGRYGTICLPNGGVMKGAEIFEVAYYGATSQKIFFDQIMDGVMEAGVPYLFLPKEGYKYLGVEYTDALNAPAGDRNGLYGSYTREELPSDGSCYILLNNQYCQVLSAENYVGANKAYFKLGDITPTAPALAPGRIRMSIGAAAPQVATGIDQITNDQLQMTDKVIIDGRLFIIRGEKLYDATGRLVK